MTITCLLALVGCASADVSKDRDEPSVCTGTKANSKLVIIIAAYTKPPVGMSVQDSDMVVKSMNQELDYLSREFFAYLANYAVGGTDGTRVRTGAWGSDVVGVRRIHGGNRIFGGDRLIHDQAAIVDDQYTDLRQDSLGYPIDRNLMRLIRAKGATPAFVLCRSSQCAGLREPVGGGVVKKKPAQNGVSGWFYVDDAESVSPDVDGVEPIPPIAKLIVTTPWHIGSFVESHYWSIPKSVEDSACSQMHLPPSCMTFGESENPYLEDQCQKKVCTLPHDFEAGGFKTFTCDQHFSADFSGTGPLPAECKSFIVLDLMALNTEVTSETKGDWIIKRIEWNPETFCKYARNRSTDFVTH